MTVFVATILVMTIVAAAVYVVFLTPEQPEGQPAPHAIDQDGQ